MKITIIGSTQYKNMFLELKERLTNEGHEVKIPAFDDHKDLDELGVCEHNRDLIKWADEIHLIWDRRSTGTIFDFGMCFMAGKPLVIEYLEPKTFEGVMVKYADHSRFS
jgi:nucleoside 2-deoxyribosyltransferase